jgi:RND superfamily putative drug exporter
VLQRPLRNPRAVLAIWGTVVGLLGLAGMGVQDRLHRTEITVSGTPGARADEEANRYFGTSQSLVVLLRGPRTAIDRQGKELAGRLDRRASIAVLGPWAPGASTTLRPGKDKALVFIRADQDFEEVARHVVPLVRREVRETIEPPVTANVSGYPDVSNGLNSASIDALKRAELIAAPILLIVLLFVFRSPVAAGIPLVLGFTTVGAASGLLDIINRFTKVDAIGLNMASMFGLALGVDYSLLVVSRFREELAAGAEVPAAAATAMRTAGRTALFAGCALALAMIAGTLMAPGNVLVSAGLGTLPAIALSVIGAATALPALLLILGRRIDKWQIGGSRAGGGRWAGAAVAASARPVLTAALVLVLLAALAAPALGLQMSSPDPRMLPQSHIERRDFDQIIDALPGSWAVPFNVLITSPRGPVTDPRHLRAIDEWQQELAGAPNVLAVLGPKAIYERSVEARDSFDSVRKRIAAGRRQLGKLSSGLGDAGRGVIQLRSGIAVASDGAAAIAAGGNQARVGSARFTAGLAEAEAGATRLHLALIAAADGASGLTAGAERAQKGAASIVRGIERAKRKIDESVPAMAVLARLLRRGERDLDRLREPVKTATENLRQARSALEAMLPTSKGDPQWALAYVAVLRATGAMTGKDPVTGAQVDKDYDGLDSALATASEGSAAAAKAVEEIHEESRRLARGLGRIANGARELDSGLERLSAGTEELLEGLRTMSAGAASAPAGLAALREGAAALESGLADLHGGASNLAGGLRDGYTRSAALASGVGRIRTRVERTEARSRRETRSPVAPRVFDSGYVTLAGLDKAKPESRSASTFAVNLDRGGSATRLLVIDKNNPADLDDPLRSNLESSARDFSERSGLGVAVGGPATTLRDFPESASNRLIPTMILLALVTYLALVPIVRSLVLPLLAVILNLLTVAAAFGVLTLLFQGDAPLGGPGQVDAIMVLAIFSIVFGLSIDYEVFLLARIREGYSLTGTTEGAIEYGLRHTATVITGAALIMTGVFFAFALSEVTNLRELGVGLTVAVLLDATVVRLLLLPAAIRLAGPANWWLPGWLERRLPSTPAPRASARTTDA